MTGSALRNSGLFLPENYENSVAFFELSEYTESMKNYYDILGVARNATSEEIKAAYRRLAKKYHPDAASETPENKARFQEIQEAYSVLSDPEKRRTYNYYGHSAYTSSSYAQHHHASPEDFTSPSGEEGVREGHCGACENGRETKKDPTWYKHEIRVMITLNMEEVFQDVIREVEYVERIDDMPSGVHLSYSEKKWTFHVKIPAGVYHEQLIPFEEAVMDNEEMLAHFRTDCPGNYYHIIVYIKTPAGYHREGWHLTTSCEVDYWTLVLGGGLTVQAPDGPCRIFVPAGTLPSSRLCAKEKGLNYPPYISGRSNLYVDLKLRIPRDLTPAQNDAMIRLREAFTPVLRQG